MKFSLKSFLLLLVTGKKDLSIFDLKIGSEIKKIQKGDQNEKINVAFSCYEDIIFYSVYNELKIIDIKNQ